MKEHRKNVLGVVVLLVVLLAGLGGHARCAAAGTKLTILHYTDFHGALLSEDTDRETGRPIGGAVALAACVRAERETAGEEVILLDSGDLMQGSAISNLSRGQAVIAFMNEIGVDACALGNHDFDWGIAVLRDRMKQAGFPFLSANIFLGKKLVRPEWARPYAVIQKGKLKVGAIGVTTTDTPFVSNPKNLKGLRFDDPEGIVNALAAALRKEGVQVVIVVAHVGGAQEEDGTVVGPIADFTARLKGVDAVLGGHSHTVVCGTVGGIPVMIPASNGRRLGVMRLDFDASSGRTSLVDQKTKLIFADGAEAETAVTALVQSYQRKFSKEMERVVAVASVKIPTDRKESPLGNLMSDVMRQAVGAKIAFQNSGGIRADMEKGPITVAHVFKIIPFDNTIVTMQLTGEQVKQVLEQGTSRSSVTQVSGIRYTYDPREPAGQRIKHVELEDGTPISPKKLYLIATNDYMASGGDRFEVFKHGKGIRNSQILVRDAIIVWMERIHKAGKQVTPPATGRAREVQ
ncbi:MAG: 5'-nucleotidase C-terminal domain-containing protein [Candidatus Eisenbacteria bacterium]